MGPRRRARARADAQEVTLPEPEAPGQRPAPAVSFDRRTFAAGIEGLAAFEPQRPCDATAKPGTTALRNLILRDNPGSRNLGIVRGCSRSAAAPSTSRVGPSTGCARRACRYALARRMGVMYVIWNQRMWASYRAAAEAAEPTGALPRAQAWAATTATTVRRVTTTTTTSTTIEKPTTTTTTTVAQ